MAEEQSEEQPEKQLEKKKTLSKFAENIFFSNVADLIRSDNISTRCEGGWLAYSTLMNLADKDALKTEWGLEYKEKHDKIILIANDYGELNKLIFQKNTLEKDKNIDKLEKWKKIVSLSNKISIYTTRLIVRLGILNQAIDILTKNSYLQHRELPKWIISAKTPQVGQRQYAKEVKENEK